MSWLSDPIAVAVSIVLAVVLAVTAPSWWFVPSRLFLAPVLVALCVIDLRERRLPDRIVLPSVAVAFVLLAGAALLDGAPRLIGTAVLGAVIFAGVLFALHLASPSGMGFGDVKLGLLLGLYLGSVRLSLVVWGLLLGSLVGVVMAVPVALRTRNRSAGIPFGPALAAGTVVALVLG
jgi:leader peptidase (prepilin peptidase)/N-methyltransferase